MRGEKKNQLKRTNQAAEKNENLHYEFALGRERHFINTGIKYRRPGGVGTDGHLSRVWATFQSQQIESKLQEISTVAVN